MRFTTFLYSGVLALATAQSNAATTTTPAFTNTAATAQSSQQAAITACLAACKSGDVDCQSKCISVPNPDAADANATNKCVSECPKGNGTATDNLNYANCVDGCISKYYYTATGTPAQPTAGSGGSGSGSGAGGSGSPSGTAGNQASGTASGTGSKSTSSSAAVAGGLSVTGSTVGFLGLLAAVLAV